MSMRSALVLTAAMAVALVASARLARSEDADWLKLAKQGSSHYTLSDYPQAIRCWERAAKLNPQAWAVQANLAKAYLQLARYRDALAASERAIAIGMPPVSAGNELGHAIGGLDDAYADPSVMGQFPDYGPAEERGHPNTTREANAKRAKWHYWLLPPALPADEAVGCVEGGWFREKGYFHPARTCRMRASGAKKYCAVCLEQVELSFYSRIEPVDDVSVRIPDVLLWKGDATRLSATAIAIAAGREKLGGFTARWYVDDRPAPASAVSSGGVKTELNLPALKLPPGPHEAVVRIDLRDARIRRDGGLLSSLRAWRVNVADGPAPKIVAPGRITAVRGAPVMFDVAVEGGTPETRAVVWGLPGSSMFPCADRVERVVWCPPRNARGIFPVTISIGKGEAAVKHTTEVVLLDPAHQVSPVFRDQGVVLATRGKELILRLEAFDADGDGLCFSAKKLPPGATLEARTGVLRWTPGWSTPFDAESDVVVRVSDGLAEDEISFKMIVDNRPVEAASGTAFDVLLSARSPSAEVRQAAFTALLASDLPRGGKLLELVRLLRDAEPDIAAKACETLSGALDVSEPSTKGLVALDLAEHLWQLSDRPDALVLAKRLLESPPKEAQAAAARIQKDLAAIEVYNRQRKGP